MDEVRTAVRGAVRQFALVVGVVAVAGAAPIACRDARGTAVANTDTSFRLRPGYVIDSVRPIEAELARFKAAIGPAPTELVGGAGSMADLLSSFARAVSTGDTLALDRMAISAPEFAYLIYPSSPYTAPPYKEAPQNVWYQLRAAGAGGRTRLMSRRGGMTLRIVSRQCDAAPAIEGENKLWRHCIVVTTDSEGRDSVRERLFGVVIERHRRFKFASYENQY